MTAEDERIAQALSTGLGQLRSARPRFQADLERRLLDRLADPSLNGSTAPWWRRAVTARAQARPRARGTARPSRRSLIGLAAASAAALAAATLSLPLVGTPEVSAREILEKVQANTENPMLAGVKSFHLTAKIWADQLPGGDKSGPHEMTTEQWFVAPDKMRTETRWRDSSGRTILSGMIVSGGELKPYASDGVNDEKLIGVFMMPVGARPGGVAAPPRRRSAVVVWPGHPSWNQR
jgi:hypothetical protein